MILWLLSIYFGTIIGAVSATVFLIVFGQGWGRLPKMYLKIVAKIQSCFPDIYPENTAPWPSIIEKNPAYKLERLKGTSTACFRHLKTSDEPFELANDSMMAGLEAIIQDEVSGAYERAPSQKDTLLRFTPVNIWSPAQRALFYATLMFRIFFLFPIRFSLLITSFAWVLMVVAISFVKKYSDCERTSISIIYCRLYGASMGFVGKFHERQNRPQKPGIAISNHMSPNDVQMLFADVQHGASYGFVVTGQRHGGLIGVIQKLADRISPCMWLERRNGDERRSFQSEAIKIARESGPVLLFPEGYCSNNTLVFQFRKALFQDAVNIYPMAIKQNGQFGDGFWSEDEFYVHLFRLMISWAVVYEVTYLPKMVKSPEEDPANFATRCQTAIAEAAGITASTFDGGLWYKKEEQKRLRELQQKTCSDRFDEATACLESDSSSSSSSSIGSPPSVSSSGYESLSEALHPSDFVDRQLLGDLDHDCQVSPLPRKKCSQEISNFHFIPSIPEQSAQ
ncbi:unnamed protein product, partial [Mesorhabditis spiculigera]